GIYTFGTVMSNIANTGVTGIHPKDLIKSWLKNYTIPVTVNGQTIGARPYVIDFLIAPWLHKAGVSGTIDMTNWESLWNAANENEILYNAPFKLTAIVNRIDLRGNSGYSPGLHNTGETRFIFSLVDPYAGIPPIQCNNNFACLDFLDWKGMNIIFEFGNVQTNICQVRSFAQQWLALSSLTLGSNDYKTALENITRTVLNAGGAPGKINGSAINRIRTNERIFDNAGKSSSSWMYSDWEFRQFELDATSGLFVQVPLTNTPVNSANATQDLSYSPTIPLTTADQNNLINWVFSSPANLARVHNGTHSMPNTYGGLPLKSGGARVDAEYTHFWDLNWFATASDAPNYGPYIPVDPNSVYYKQVRQQLSLNTCSGCHNGETKTIFTEVMPMGYGTPANYWT
ncbi:MAG: hypothetical protein JSS96_17485, partial [Bacteroidetes bacterium]|nr:hypothetical protein [Bacteroidota bacterium]